MGTLGSYQPGHHVSGSLVHVAKLIYHLHLCHYLDCVLNALDNDEIVWGKKVTGLHK